MKLTGVNLSLMKRAHETEPESTSLMIDAFMT
jgi:hypothetical protein